MKTYLVPSECGTDFSSAGAHIDVDDTRVRALGADPAPHVAYISRPQAAGKALRDSVVPLDGLLEFVEDRDVEDGREDFLLPEVGFVGAGGTRDGDDWLDEVATVEVIRQRRATVVPRATAQELGASAAEVVDGVFIYRYCLLSVQRSEKRAGYERIAWLQFGVHALEFLEESV